MTFCGDPRAVQGLRYAGVDVACTANNHIGNYADVGIAETWRHLRAAGIGVCGLGQTDIVTVRGLRFAFLAFNCVGQRFDYAAARREIRAARARADVVVVCVHWGKEYVAVPTVAPGIADDDPRRVAHWIIDSGADLIIGNHPHHVQGIELYHGHLITYAHGNFVFDQMFSPADCPGDVNFVCTTEEGVVGAYTFYRKRLVAVHYRPVVIYDWSQPRWATASQARIILRGMRDATLQLARRGRRARA
jgi:poly-gamma-glutamate synthesis protein (capsule biosynthesis protein)